MMSTARRCLPPLAVLALLALLALPSAASAHRLDEYLQATLVSVEPDAVRVSIQLTPGVAVADVVVALVDHDHDGSISPDEAATYVELLKRDLLVGLNGVQVPLKVVAAHFPEPAELRTGSGIIRVEFMAPISVPVGTHGVALENRHLPATSAYLLNAARPNSPSVWITRQTRNENQSAGAIEFTFQARPDASRASLRFVLIAIVCAGIAAAVWLARKLASRPRPSPGGSVLRWLAVRPLAPTRSPGSPGYREGEMHAPGERCARAHGMSDLRPAKRMMCNCAARAVALAAPLLLFAGGCVPYRSHLEPLVFDLGATWVPSPDMYIAFGEEARPFGDAELKRAIRHLKPLPRLDLVLADTRITDASAPLLATLSNLKELDVAGTKISDASMPYLARLPRLEEVILTGTPVSPEGIRSLAKAKRLKRIVVAQDFLPTEQARELERQLPRARVYALMRGRLVPLYDVDTWRQERENVKSKITATEP